MNTHFTFLRQLRPACIVFALSTALAGALVMWALTLSSSHDHSSVRLAGSAVATSDCIARKLGQAPRLALENRSGTPRAQVSVLAGTKENPTRVVYEGNARLNFVIAVTPTGPDTSSAHLTTLPTYDPASLVNAIIGSCDGR